MNDPNIDVYSLTNVFMVINVVVFCYLQIESGDLVKGVDINNEFDVDTLRKLVSTLPAIFD